MQRLYLQQRLDPRLRGDDNLKAAEPADSPAHHTAEHQHVRVLSGRRRARPAPRHEKKTTGLIFSRCALRPSTASSVAMLLAPACSAQARCKASPARRAAGASRAKAAARWKFAATGNSRARSFVTNRPNRCHASCAAETSSARVRPYHRATAALCVSVTISATSTPASTSIPRAPAQLVDDRRPHRKGGTRLFELGGE